MSLAVTPFGRCWPTMDMMKLLVMKSEVFITSRNVCLAFSGGILLEYCGANFATSSPAGVSSS
jgi:hypothetical protein